MSTNERPLSPHLQIYRWQWTMALSFSIGQQALVLPSAHSCWWDGFWQCPKVRTAMQHIQGFWIIGSVDYCCLGGPGRSFTTYAMVSASDMGYRPRFRTQYRRGIWIHRWRFVDRVHGNRLGCCLQQYGGYRDEPSVSLSRVRGLGSAKNGTHHWWIQRVTAVALVPLTLWFAVSIIKMTGAAHSDAIAWVSRPFNAIMLLMLIIATFHHMQLGLQVVIEDYIHSEGTKIVPFAGAESLLVFALAIAASFCCAQNRLRRIIHE